ncbi:lipocalin family protein [Mesorhizobium sp. BAC0120]|uniref:lipocalin family protein n=1 Tax=Mesorhizobium sp. BAC0120 TaxID=3090670 RepID=UPI00298C30FA|nr:lipocalin family protein [Mesorhizobium sp. BAC0120]MDW6025997.1 lipocalin family protein [Mesorhizobium sp. BAC0120]
MVDVTAVPNLDFSRYLGRWYEIWRLPLKQEDENATDITATYSLNDGKIRVDNRCFDKDGKPIRAIGEATAVGDSTSRLKVSFLPAHLRWIPFTHGDYWVLKIDPDYKTALVGTPDRKHIWLLSRQPALPDATREDYLAEARRQGFDLSGLITPRHAGREVTNAMVEKS